MDKEAFFVVLVLDVCCIYIRSKGLGWFRVYAWTNVRSVVAWLVLFFICFLPGKSRCLQKWLSGQSCEQMGSLFIVCIQADVRAFWRSRILQSLLSSFLLGTMMDLSAVKTSWFPGLLLNESAKYTRDRLTQHVVACKAVCLLHMCGASFSCKAKCWMARCE